MPHARGGLLYTQKRTNQASLNRGFNQALDLQLARSLPKELGAQKRDLWKRLEPDITPIHTRELEISLD